jgi:hypothetical protein
VHIDVKKLGRIADGAGHRMTGRRHYTPRLMDVAGRRRGTAGWECVHIAIDDCTRLAYAEVLPDEKASTAIAFLGDGCRSIASRQGLRRHAAIGRQPPITRLNDLLGTYN